MKSKSIGFHKNCSGRVIININGDGYGYPRCSSCMIRVISDDIVVEKMPFVRQKSSGRKARRPKYDINNWNEIKIK